MKWAKNLQSVFLRPRLSLLTLSVALLASSSLSACAKRIHLSPSELQRVGQENIKALRVYTSDKLLVMYDESTVQESYEVNRKVAEQSQKDRLKVVIDKGTAGLIIEQDESNGAPVMWVTFDPSCQEKTCAYGFVQTEDQHYRLMTLPQPEGYKSGVAYQGCRKRKMSAGKLASLAEANEVLLHKKGSGDVMTVKLDIMKQSDKSVKTKVQRNRGID